MSCGKLVSALKLLVLLWFGRVGEIVKVATRVLPVHCSSTQLAKLLSKFIGPFEVSEIVAAVEIHLKLPYAYVSTHGVFQGA